MPGRVDTAQRQLATLVGAASGAERDELREIQQTTGWQSGGGVTVPHGNAAAALELIASIEDEEWAGTMPVGSAQTLRRQLREQLHPGATGGA